MNSPQRLRAAVFAHNNDYGPHPLAELAWMHPLSVCCVVPYYDTGPLATAAVSCLSASLDAYRSRFEHPPATQIVVVDDGSPTTPFQVSAFAAEVSVIRLAENQGRSRARNVGLRAASGYDLVLFVDSDVVVAADQIEQIVRLWSLHQRPESPDPCVVANFFTTLTVPCELDMLDTVAAQATVEADWRVRCRYQPSWIGCPSDWLYVGEHFQLVEQTRQFRDWSGMVGPWCLPNMVLGGCFAVPTGAALDVGGFDESFDSYGFTETTLVARLMAGGVPVVPQLASAAVHVEWNPAHFAQRDRNDRFRRAHRRFFVEFLGAS